MTTETVTRAPSRRKARVKLNLKANKKAQPKIVAKTKPVVDVPTGKDNDVNILVKANRESVEKYLKKNFDGVNKNMVDSVAKECAECVTYQRTPKKSEAWGKEIIEEVILACFPALNEKDHEESKNKNKPVQKVTRKAGAKKTVEKKVEKKETKKAATKEPATKKAATKKDVTKELITKKAGTKKLTTKKAAPKKVTKKTGSTNSGGSQVGVADLIKDMKEAKGVQQFEAACVVLKKQKKVWMQAQDISSVAKHLFAVHTNKAKLKDEGLPGQGEKSYGQRRLVKTLELIRALIK